ncbi:facilitated trehalose transporter Tret1-like [Harmonia axyridis]|uniref:facilitated trehalose transporter Tret1-like n=1 Tax=Harmonia axyridis TaxID=115357 RepID=UPI001E277F6C|nr:facilitated trehalose transporter Tret1-like [Harmonia axyridis]
MATWEKFAALFGDFYNIFVALTAHSMFTVSCLSFAWSSSVLPKLLESQDSPLQKPITANESDLIGAIFYIGAAIGPLCFISVVNKLGRKKVLAIISLIPPIAYGILIFAKSVTLYIVCRTFLGIYVGAAFSIQPVYLAEVLAMEERAFLMSFVTLFSFIGVFTAFTVGHFIPVVHFNGLIAVLSTIVLILVTFGFPDSPYYVIQHENNRKMMVLLKKLRTRRVNVNEEFEEIQNRAACETEDSWLQIFCTKDNIKALISATIPLLLQSSCGVIFLMNYNQLIFMQTSITISSHYCSIIVVSLTFSTTFLAPILLKRKKITPGTLLMCCLLGVGVCNIIMSLYFFYGRHISYLSWLPLMVLVCSVLIYNCGLDPIPWMILGNSYPVSISAVGTAVSISIFELSVFPTMFLFHKVNMSYLFLFSSICCALGIVYVKFVVGPSEELIFEKITRNFKF